MTKANKYKTREGDVVILTEEELHTFPHNAWLTLLLDEDDDVEKKQKKTRKKINKGEY